MKKISIILLFAIFLAFLFYELPKSDSFKVLKVNSPTQIIVDTNNNGMVDSDETITLKNVQSFSTKPDEAQSELAKKLKITDEDAMGLGFLSQNFAKEKLADKNIRLIILKTKPLQIIVDNKNYENMLLDSGFAVKKDAKMTSALSKNLEKVKKLNLVIFNNKSQKYHKLNCKYGLIAHNSQIIPATQLPKEAKPCKFCHGRRLNGNKNKYGKNDYENYYFISYIKSPPDFYQTNNIKIFLTDFTKVSKPSNSCDTQVCRALVNEINSAQNSIDFAIYGYTKVQAIENALKKAGQRGVKIRLVYDTDGKGNNIYPNTDYLAQIIKSNRTDRLPPIMHDKFFIFDHQKVLTGSANMSDTDMSGFNSNVVILINSQKIAQDYSQEFNQMFGGKFHDLKSRIPETSDTVDGADIFVYFSPEDKPITNQVIPLINSSKKYVYIPAFLITHKSMADSLINAFNRGVDVKIILDATNTHTASSKMKMLREKGIPVKTENYGGKLHSKSIIIDDMYTLIGSMNFSRSGEKINDENLIVIKNVQIAHFYKEFFLYMWKKIPDKWLRYNARAESPDSIGSCSDGLDNDFDGKIDKADNSCQSYKK